MSEHTPEPWVFSPDRHTHDSFIHAENATEVDGYIYNDNGGVFGSSEWNWFKPEDAARAVACVNACSGINPEAVPDVVAALRGLLRYEGLVVEYMGGMGNVDAERNTQQQFNDARAALAKMEIKQ